LDVDTIHEEGDLLDRLHGTITHYKIGMRLFTAHGRRAVDLVHKKGGRVFLDLKLHDIPETVSQAVRQAQRLKVFSVSVHLCGGAEMLKAAAAVSPRPKLWGVTVLTSLANEDVRFLHPEADVNSMAARLAQLGEACRIDGIICSAREVPDLKKLLGPKTCFVTPGIRPADAAASASGAAKTARKENDWRAADDQRRIVTPAAAARLGIRYVVIGRPITRARDPLRAAQSILAEMRHAAPSSLKMEKT
jgi:orotidine-5'-phosphate decarboxylase